MYKAILLDVDGTLVHSNDLHAQAWKDALDEMGYKVSFNLIRPLIGMGADNLLPTLLSIRVDEPIGKEITRRRQKIFQEQYLSQVKAFPMSRDLLQLFISQHLNLVAATSASKEDLQAILEMAQLDDLISLRVNGDDVDGSKPDPDIVLAALNKAAVAPSQALMLGDTPYDIFAARKAGVDTVAFMCGGWTRSQLRGSKEIYKDPAQLFRNIEHSAINGFASHHRTNP